MNEQRKTSGTKKRPQRTSTSVVFDRKTSTSNPIGIHRRDSNSSTGKRKNNDKHVNTNGRGRSSDLKVENLDALSMRRSSSTNTFFTGATQEVFQEHEDLDYRERYRNVLRELYAEQEDEKQQQYKKFRQKLTWRQKEQLNEGRSKVVKFIQYMATEHETLLQLLVFLPPFLMALYIALIEESPLIFYD